MKKLHFSQRDARRTCACCALLLAAGASSALAQQRASTQTTASPPLRFDRAVATERSSDLGEASELLNEFRSLGQFREYKETLAYGLRLTHYIADARFDLPLLTDTRIRLTANVGVGATRLRTADGYSARLAANDLAGTYLSLRGGISIAYRFADRARVFVGAQEYLHFDQEAALLQRSEASVRDLSDAALTFPITLGVDLSVN